MEMGNGECQRIFHVFDDFNYRTENFHMARERDKSRELKKTKESRMNRVSF